MKIKVIGRNLTVCKILDIKQVDFNDRLCFLGKTDDEISLVCSTNSVPSSVLERDDGWSAFRVEGVLDFSLTGILAKISNILADCEIGIFAISTFNTDYILTKNENLTKSLIALEKNGYTIMQ